MVPQKTSSINPSLIQFSSPERNDLALHNRHYYFQNLSYNGEDLYLESEWFESEGIKIRPFSKPDMMFRCSGVLKESLDIVQLEALRQLNIPAEYNIPQANSSGIFKPLAKSNYLFAKLGQGAQCFNENCQPVRRESLSYGQYRVIVHVKGIYIGPHGDSPLKASLQLKIRQVQYMPVVAPCLFSSAKINYSTPPPSTILGVTVPGAPKKKTTRKPKLLQRQNAIIDTDFLVDLDNESVS